MSRIKNIDLKNVSQDFLALWRNASGLIAYTTITQIYYQGVIAGSEFLTYAATKLYICSEIQFSYSSGAMGAVICFITYYDIANAAFFYHSKQQISAANYVWNTKTEKNLYFSRFTALGYTYMKFIGYRLNV